ncbi:MAG: hypothetical protein WAL01_13310 [Pseudolabrys sp.]
MRARALVAIALAFVAVASARKSAAQQDLFGRAIWSYQTVDSSALATNSFHQTYDLRLERVLTDTFRFRLSFRGEANDGTSSFDETGSQQTQFRQYQPGAEVNYVLPTIQFKGNYDDIRTTAETGDLADDRRLRRLYGVLTFRPDECPRYIGGLLHCGKTVPRMGSVRAFVGGAILGPLWLIFLVRLRARRYRNRRL